MVRLVISIFSQRSVQLEPLGSRCKLERISFGRTCDAVYIPQHLAIAMGLARKPRCTTLMPNTVLLADFENAVAIGPQIPIFAAPLMFHSVVAQPRTLLLGPSEPSLDPLSDDPSLELSEYP